MQLNWANFFECGAFISQGESVWLMQGPFSASPNPTHLPALHAPDFFYQSHNNWYYPSKFLKLNRKELLKSLSNLQLKHKTPPFFQAESFRDINRTSFAESWQRVQAGFGSSIFEKCVPIVQSHGVGNFSALANRQFLFKNSLHGPSNSIAYGFWMESEGIVGISPELLFSTKGLQISTAAIAGTSNRIGHKLLQDTKELLEHSFVVQYLTEKLAKFGRVEVDPTEELPFGMLTHLKTSVKAYSKFTQDIPKLINELHPTPALGLGSGKVHWEWLKNLPEQNSRNRFGAPFGMLIPEEKSGQESRQKSGEESIFAVAIRNIQWVDNRFSVGSGCGIVRSSVFDNEWNELKLKQASIYKMLGISFDDQH